MKRLIEYTVFREFVTAWRFADSPTNRSPLLVKATTDGVVRLPSEFSKTSGSPASITAMQEFDFDTILYPINFCTHFQSKFEEQVLIEAKKRNMGILALKAIAKQKWASEEGKRQDYKKCWYEPIDELHTAKLAQSWTLYHGVTEALPPGEEKLFRLAADIAPECRAINDSEIAELREYAKSLVPIFQT